MQGFARTRGYFGVQTCTDFCTGLSGTWDETVFAAFDLCVSTDPLCFQTIDQCMFLEIFADEFDQSLSVEHAIVVKAAGFESVNSRFAYIEFADSSTSLGVDQTRVQNGAFEFRLDLNQELPFGTYDVFVYVDSNENINCDADADLIFGADIVPIYGSNPLEFRLELDPSMAVASFMAESICTNAF